MCLLCESSRDSISRLTSSTLHSISALPSTSHQTEVTTCKKKLIQTAQLFVIQCSHTPEHLHLHAQLRYTVVLGLIGGEKRMAAAIGTLPAAEVTLWQVSLQTPPLHLHRTSWGAGGAMINWWVLSNFMQKEMETQKYHWSRTFTWLEYNRDSLYWKWLMQNNEIETDAHRPDVNMHKSNSFSR